MLFRVAILILTASLSSAFVQSSEFEVASIKPSDPHSTPTRRMRTTGRDVYANSTVLILIRLESRTTFRTIKSRERQAG